ncbi:MAG: hypothetical protein WKF35_07070 [Ferruginibacter sp.]
MKYIITLLCFCSIIVKGQTVSHESVTKPNKIAAKRTGELPAPILKIAVSKNSSWIEQKSFKDGEVYRFQASTDKINSSRINFDGQYYDANGEISTAKINNLSFTSWWHMYKGKFYNTRFRPGYR